MTKSARAVMCIFAVPALIWAAASLYFTIAGHDTSGDCLCAYLPEWRNLRPEENAYVAIRELAGVHHRNDTLLGTNYVLRKAYLVGTTNQLDLADEALAYLAAESNTFAVVGRILAAKGIATPLPSDDNGFAEYTMGVCKLQGIAHVLMVKATYEAVRGDLAAGRMLLMDIYRIGRLLQTQDTLGMMFSDIIGGNLCGLALATAKNRLFAPEGDEAWRAKLRELMHAITEGDAGYAKLAARRGLACFALTYVGDCLTNRAAKVQIAITGWHYPLKFPDFAKIQDEPRDSSFGDFESRFLAALATACPGYTRYSFQPNRTVDSVRICLEEFCRKVDDPAYDFEYAAKPLPKAPASRFLRNWLGEELLSCHTGFNGYYRMIFSRRFLVRAFETILACRSYKAKHGAYPEALSALVPEFLAEVPRDPYDGEELRYNAKGGYIWTRGEKLSFNGEVEIWGGKPHYKSIRDSRCVRFLDDDR